MKYLYSQIIDAHRGFPPQIAAHRVICATNTLVHVECNIAGIWTPEIGIVLRSRPRRPAVRLLSRLILEEYGYASDGLCTYYTKPDAVQNLIHSLLVRATIKRRGK